jgi:hypothetical protein
MKKTMRQLVLEFPNQLTRSIEISKKSNLNFLAINQLMLLPIEFVAIERILHTPLSACIFLPVLVWLSLHGDDNDQRY